MLWFQKVLEVSGNAYFPHLHWQSYYFTMLNGLRYLKSVVDCSQKAEHFHRDVRGSGCELPSLNFPLFFAKKCPITTRAHFAVEFQRILLKAGYLLLVT